MQYNKVEICGVNTSKLKVLKEAEKRELLEKIKNGTPKERAKAREEMISGNLRLVLSVIQRFTNRGENPDDLFQVGCIGLIKAIDNFDCTLKVRFSTYGVPMIIGEIRRYLRDNNSIRVSRSMRDTAYKAMQVKEQMTAQNNKEPTVEEIAKALDMPKENVVLALEAIVEPVSLYEPVFSDGSDTIYVMDQVGDKNDDHNWLDEIALKEAIASLSDREKRILSLRFFKGKTQMEVASEIGISQAQVSRIEKGALEMCIRDRRYHVVVDEERLGQVYFYLFAQCARVGKYAGKCACRRRFRADKVNLAVRRTGAPFKIAVEGTQRDTLGIRRLSHTDARAARTFQNPCACGNQIAECAV